jgi:peptidyl-prolyl cis-trans isomerase A (cyclophilin A)
MSCRVFPLRASHANVAAWILLPTSILACTKAPPEPDAVRADPIPASASAPAPSSIVPSASPSGEGATAPKPSMGADPRSGNWTLADATKDVKGKGSLVAKVDTNKGILECKLLEDKAPVTVANFVGLAMGTRPWKDPKTREWVTRPAYDGTTFHRIIKGELWAGAKHDRAGLLCMANRGPNTNGAQFFITDEAAAHLDSSYTIFGECSPVATVHAIASVPVTGESPVTPVVIASVKILRNGK